MGMWMQDPCFVVECPMLFIDHSNTVAKQGIYETKIQVICDHNYETSYGNEGFLTSCEDMGNWSISEKLKKCEGLTLQHTNITNQSIAANTTQAAQCDTGYEIETRATIFKYKCNLLREWRGVYNCTIMECSTLLVDHSEWYEYIGQWSDKHIVRCNEGYLNQKGSREIMTTCTDTKNWEPLPVCTAIPCVVTKPYLTNQGDLNTHYPLTKFVTCVTGAKVKGTKKSTVYATHCTANGTFSTLHPCEYFVCRKLSQNDFDWKANAPRMVYASKRTQLCEKGKEAAGGVKKINIQCNEWGVWNATKCFKTKCPVFLACNVAESGMAGTYRKSVTIKCPEGHETATGLVEYNTTCGANKKWSQVHHCWRRNCSAYSIKDTTAQNVTEAAGFNMTIYCTFGHTITDIVNSFELRCDADGKWVHPEVFCNLVECPPFMVTNSISLGPAARVFGRFGDSVTVRCSPGYLLNDSRLVAVTTCDGSGHWNWTGFCKAINCPELTHDMSVVPDRPITSEGELYKMYEFRCAEGYSDISPPNGTYTSCLADSQWTPVPTCSPMCLSLGKHEFGTFSPSNETKVGTEVRYTCNTTLGYRMKGNYTTITCIYTPTRGSEWTAAPPKCERIPVDGNWTVWSEWTRCPVTCGEGYRQRERHCNPPQYEGLPCKGSATGKDMCNSVPCTVDLVLGLWSDWGPCEGTCGIGFSARKRKCTDGKNGGTTCRQLKARMKAKVKFIETKQCELGDCAALCTKHTRKVEDDADYKEADEANRIFSTCIGCTFIGIVIGTAIMLDIAAVAIKASQARRNTVVIERIPPK